MNKIFNSLRIKLFLWYILSLLILGIFIILTIHIFQFKYSFEVLTVVFIILSLVGFFLIYGFTKSLADLSSQIKTISSKNLDERIKNIERADEIGELAQSFNDLLDRLNKAFRRERQFIADVAHEMKTPLTILRSSLEVTLNHERNKKEYKQIIKGAIIETDRLSSTLKNVLDLAWSETPNENQRNTFSLSDLMVELDEIAKNLALHKEIAVTSSFEKNIKVYGFKDKLGRAILNIIDNAIKYTPAKKTVNLTLKKENNAAIIRVKDSGQGIKKEDQEHVFDRFYRGSKTDKVFGAGLGLAIAKSTIEMHSGSISIGSKINQGSTFTIVLPIG